MLWVDKYRPKSLDKIVVHEDVAQNLKKLVPFHLLPSSDYLIVLFGLNPNLICSNG